MSFSFKSRYGIEDLLEIMALLRSPGGCPWDIEQDHLSIRENLIEETYEVLDAIDSGDTENLREELGDLLLQVVFHSRMEQEAGSFDFNDVCHDICHKLIIRHPHVFADVQADTPEEVLRSVPQDERLIFFAPRMRSAEGGYCAVGRKASALIFFVPRIAIS